MTIQIMWVGKTAFSFINEGIEIYIKRLKHYGKVEIKEIKIPKYSNKLTHDEIKKLEGNLILKELDSSSHLILFDEGGKSMSSEQFAKFIQNKMNSGQKKVVFLIGGAYGFSDKVYQRANEKLSLSKMTFSHQMIRIFALEQIYRGFTILRGEPYHHE